MTTYTIGADSSEPFEKLWAYVGAPVKSLGKQDVPDMGRGPQLLESGPQGDF